MSAAFLIPTLNERVRNAGRGPHEPPAPGAVIYWMSREIRARDNWALVYAMRRGAEWGKPVYAVYNLAVGFLGGALRQHAFKVEGLRVAGQGLAKLKIPFYVDTHDDFAAARLPELSKQVGAALVVTDFCPLRTHSKWVAAACAALPEGCALHEVDAHNVVPCWVASPKAEVGARTLRPKLHRVLDHFLADAFPELAAQRATATPAKWGGPTDFTALLAPEVVKQLDASVKPVSWLESGEEAAAARLAAFLKSLSGYSTDRNDPARDPTALSNLSPYFHYGMLAPQRAITAVRGAAAPKADKDTFIEEALVRRELADNFCFYTPNYDTLEGIPNWAQQSLRAHAKDRREYVYSLAQFVAGETHDALWNAAQAEMVETGKMHGYMRMYWAKKILEWTPNAEEAMRIAIYLNDKYELDGRDPGGYTGIAWSIGGVHDRPWGNRAVFGGVRLMVFSGCCRKFDVNAYIARWRGAGVADVAAPKKRVRGTVDPKPAKLAKPTSARGSVASTAKDGVRKKPAQGGDGQTASPRKRTKTS